MKLSVKTCICGGNMQIVETRQREYGVYRRRKCDCCGRVISTREVYCDKGDRKQD